MKAAEARAYARHRLGINDRLKRVLIEELALELDPGQIDDDAPLFADGLGLDSIDTLSFAVAIENEFDVPIGDAANEVYRSINSIVGFILEATPPTEVKT